MFRTGGLGRWPHSALHRPNPQYGHLECPPCPEALDLTFMWDNRPSHLAAALLVLASVAATQRAGARSTSGDAGRIPVRGTAADGD